MVAWLDLDYSDLQPPLRVNALVHEGPQDTDALDARLRPVMLGRRPHADRLLAACKTALASAVMASVVQDAKAATAAALAATTDVLMKSTTP